MNLAVVVLAAGISHRFGAPNKLLQEFHGEPLLCTVLRLAKTVPDAEYWAVCSEETLPLAEQAGFCTVVNPAPELGQSHSLRLGLRQCCHTDGCIFLTGDQPFVRPETLQNLIAAHAKEPSCIIGCNVGGRFRIPSLFPAGVYEELLRQNGDIGGREVMRAHPELVRLIPVEKWEYFDIDTPEDLQKAEEILNDR